ncbi:MAG TPA: response regulator transcription factor [Pedobacter sp.]|jgi:DNA-binding response OmpR family regulator
MKILILEDNVKMASELKLFLSNKGFECDVIHDGGSFLKQGLPQYDLYLLDISVPLLNGFEVCKKIREENKQSPILMLTAYGSVSYKVQALDYGADDYLVKPFHLDELLARIKALMRRVSMPLATTHDVVYQIEDLVINASTMRVNRGGKELQLTPKEYKLLELLAQAQGRTISKQTIAEKVWDINFDTGTNTIEVYINFLRNKIDKDFDLKLIHTRPGYGYYLNKS